MTIYVEIDARPGQRSGDWVVKNGAGAGGAVIDRHRTKAAAVSNGRTEAKRRNTSLRVQATDGTWRTEANYA